MYLLRCQMGLLGEQFHSWGDSMENILSLVTITLASVYDGTKRKPSQNKLKTEKKHRVDDTPSGTPAPIQIVLDRSYPAPWTGHRKGLEANATLVKWKWSDLFWWLQSTHGLQYFVPASHGPTDSNIHTRIGNSYRLGCNRQCCPLCTMVPGRNGLKTHHSIHRHRP